MRGQPACAVIERPPGTPLDVTAGLVAAESEVGVPRFAGGAARGSARRDPQPWARSFRAALAAICPMRDARVSGRTAVATQESISLRAEGGNDAK